MQPRMKPPSKPLPWHLGRRIWLNTDEITDSPTFPTPNSFMPDGVFPRFALCG